MDFVPRKNRNNKRAPVVGRGEEEGGGEGAADWAALLSDTIWFHPFAFGIKPSSSAWHPRAS